MITVIGESLVDLVPSGPDQVGVHPGGGPFNTARALARLGQPVSFLGSISDDALGRRLRAVLASDGVSLDAVLTTALPTTLAFAELDTEAAASYRFYTEGTAAFALTPADALAVLPSQLDALVFGSLGIVLEPLAGAVTAVVQEAAGRGALTVMDPNVRASLIADRDEYLARLERLLRWTDVVKASAEDLAWLFGPDSSSEEVVSELLDRGPRLVLVTHGADGATVISVDGSVPIPVPAPRVKVVDTIGAGDAFTAGFLAWWRHRGLGREQLGELDMVLDATRFACTVASRTVEQAGPAPPALTPPPPAADPE